MSAARSIRVDAAALSSKANGHELMQRSPTGHDVLQWNDTSATLWTMSVSPSVLREDLMNVLPIRQGSQYKNRPNRHGYYYWQRTASHVWHESRLEMESLVELDFSGQVLAVAAQPFRMLFRSESACVLHDPDYLAVLANGDIVVFDVKPSSRMTPEVETQFAETARVCAAVGWQYQVLNEREPIRTRNLEYLRASRHSRCHPDQVLFEQALNVFEGGRTILQGRSMLNRRHPALAGAYINHLIWHGHLQVDLSQRLDLSNTVKTTAKGESCCAA